MTKKRESKKKAAKKSAPKRDEAAVVDAGRLEREAYVPGEEVQREFAEAERLGTAGAELLNRELSEHHSRTPELSAGDLDADWARADVGEETAGVRSPHRTKTLLKRSARHLELPMKTTSPCAVLRR